MKVALDERKLNLFEPDDNFSKIESAKLMKLVAQRWEIEKVVNVEDDKRYQAIDVDYIIKKDGTHKRIEVKTDRYESGNLYAEKYSCYQIEATGEIVKSVGCLDKTKADYLFYYFVNSKELFIFRKKGIQWLRDNMEWYAEKFPLNKARTGELYTSKGHIIPRKYIKSIADEIGVQIIKMG